MQRIQPAVEILREGIGLEHALASRRLYTDGSEVLAHFLEDIEPEHLDLTVVRTGQKQLSEVVHEYLATSPTATTAGRRQSACPHTATPA